MKLPLNGLIPEKEYGFLSRTDNNSAWVVSYKDQTLQIEQPLSELSLPQYRLIGLNDGTARVIRFADLHRHSDNSLLDSIIRVPELVKNTEYAGALTDHGNMYGFLEYYSAMNAAGKKPILGFEAYMADLEGKLSRNHVILLAKNNAGYKNLIKLTSEAFDHFHSVPHVTWEMMEQYKEGIICLSACLSGTIPRALVKGDLNEAQALVDKFVSIYGKEDFYIEIQNHHIDDEEKILPQLVSLAKNNGLKYVATTDSHYVKEEDKQAHQVVLCLRCDKTIYDANKISYDGEGYYLHNSEQMEARFREYPEALDASLEIAEKCNIELRLGDVNLPNYDYPEPFSNADDYMLHIAQEGFQARFASTSHLDDPAYKERFDYEYGVIKQMGFCAYFVIVWDFINYAKQHNIPVGPGRGSAAGSMIAYCMGITDMDPIKYNLMFERFLNPERVSMPDVDTDIAHVGRGKVFQYMTDKYGAENVCRIITFGTFKAKQALKDVARVLDYPVSVGTRLSSLIKDPKMTLFDALTEIAEFRDYYHQDPKDKEIIDLAMKIEGCKRHASVHACGFVIAPSKVTDFLPTATLADEETGEKVTTSQVVMTEVEQLSLIKMDLLGLKNLSAISEALGFVEKNVGKDALLSAIHSLSDTVKFQDIPLNDRPTYEMLRNGDTGGVFQFESGGITRVLQDMLADIDRLSDAELESVAFERMVATNALYRPGPMDYIPEYIEGLRDPKKVKYDCPQEADILSSTYGVLVYQEQLMLIAQKLAGYSLGQADLLRKACGKKKKDLMAKERERFIFGNAGTKKKGESLIPGCIGNGISKEAAEQVWEKMVKFASYAFNRSHAACYAWLGYITAYLSCHYPAEFYAAMLNAFLTDSDSEKAYLSQAQGRGVCIRLPSVQESECHYTADQKGILFGLQGIKGVKNVADPIVENRKAAGPYKDLQDLYCRLRDQEVKVNKKTMRGLIFAGATNMFSDNKAALLDQLELIEKDYKYNAKTSTAGQISLFSEEELAIPMPDTKPYEPQYELLKEFQAIGVYLTQHPADLYKKQLDGNELYTPLELLSAYPPSKTIYYALGLVQEFRECYTKSSGERMAMFRLETSHASIPCIAFPRTYREYSLLLNPLDPEENNTRYDPVVCVKGTISADSRNPEETQFIIQAIMDPRTEFQNNSSGVVLDISCKEEQDKIIAFAKAHPGHTQIILRARGYLFPTKFGVSPTAQNIDYLKSLCRAAISGGD